VFIRMFSVRHVVHIVYYIKRLGSLTAFFTSVEDLVAIASWFFWQSKIYCGASNFCERLVKSTIISLLAQ